MRFVRRLLDFTGILCMHRHQSRVFTDPKTKEKYVVCFDCTKRIPYDWDKMKAGKSCRVLSVL